MKRINGLQNLLKTMGTESCLYCCLYDVAMQWCEENKKPVKPFLESAIELIEQGVIRYNFQNHTAQENFYINNNAKVLEYLTGVEWEVEFKECKKSCNYGKFAIFKWVRKVGTVKQTHFARGNDFPLQASYIMKMGELEEVRVWKQKK